MPESPRRHEPRLSFAGRTAPVLEMPGGSCEVLDLSAEGVRVRISGPTASVTIGEVLRGIIHFPADRAVAVEGRVLRVSEGQAALHIESGHQALATSAPPGAAPPRRAGMLW